MKIKEQLKKYREKEKAIQSTQEMIRDIDKKMIAPLRAIEQKQKEELNKLGNQEVVSLSVRELIAELINITGVVSDDMYLDIDFIDMWTVQDVLSKQDKKPQLRLVISSKDPKKMSKEDLENGEYYYCIAFEGDFYEPQADGCMLIDHSYTISNEYDDLLWPSLYIKKEDIMDIICHFSLSEIERLKMYLNSDLLTKALQNQIDNQEEKKVKQK